VEDDILQTLYRSTTVT